MDLAPRKETISPIGRKQPRGFSPRCTISLDSRAHSTLYRLAEHVVSAASRCPGKPKRSRLMKKKAKKEEKKAPKKGK